MSDIVIPTTSPPLVPAFFDLFLIGYVSAALAFMIRYYLTRSYSALPVREFGASGSILSMVLPLSSETLAVPVVSDGRYRSLPRRAQSPPTSPARCEVPTGRGHTRGRESEESSSRPKELAALVEHGLPDYLFLLRTMSIGSASPWVGDECPRISIKLSKT
jgi:hypothetical protein